MESVPWAKKQKNYGSLEENLVAEAKENEKDHTKKRSHVMVNSNSDGQLQRTNMINVGKVKRPRGITESNNDVGQRKSQKRCHSEPNKPVRSWSNDDLERYCRSISATGALYGQDILTESEIDTLDEEEEEKPSQLRKCWKKMTKLFSSKLGLFVALLIYTFTGAAIFQAIEEPHEKVIKANITILRANLIQTTVNISSDVDYTDSGHTQNFTQLLEEKLRAYEDQLYSAFAHGVHANDDHKVWDYWGALFFSATVFTTIGYGHIAPSTDWGRIATMLYATIGVPLFFVVMSSIGKLLTTLLKYIWSYIRKVYYTQECRKIRKAQTIKILKERVSGRKRTQSSQSRISQSRMSDADSFVDYEVDDHFNLHPLVAITITLFYIFAGALMYVLWEPWSYLEAFYFIFVSISTIGFGDLVPDQPKYFLASSLYIILGLSLVAMVINVMMEFFNSTITKAKRKVEQMRLGLEHSDYSLKKKFSSKRSSKSKTEDNENGATANEDIAEDPFSEGQDSDYDFAQQVNRAFSLGEDDIVLEITLVNDEDGMEVTKQFDAKVLDNGHVLKDTAVP